MKRTVLLLCTIIALAAAGEQTAAYLKGGARTSSGALVGLRWEDMPVRYFVTDRSISGVTAPEFEQAVRRAFAGWSAVPLTGLASQFVGFTATQPTLNDGMTTIGFVDHPELERVLGSTSYLYVDATGEIVESDIFLNSAPGVASWSVASSGETGRFDVESIALHEIGHLFGLAHSALGETELRAGGRRVLATEAVMFPIAFSAGTIEGRTLKADDIAGIGDIYQTAEFRRERGSISGTVLKSGRGVLGAHVIAFNTRTARLVAGFTLGEDGRFVIAGLEPGPYALRVEPLDDGDFQSFFGPSVDIDVNFQVKFHDRIVVVPRGGGVSNVSITVAPK